MDLPDSDQTYGRCTKLVGDITYLPTWQGWLYLATVIDCHTKACIGYALADHVRAERVIDALQMPARNYTLTDGAIFHSDRGTQYTSQAFAEATSELGVRRSVGRIGSCFDNALAKSFNASLKVERVHRTTYPTREHARKGVPRYIEVRNNTKRLHSEIHDEYRNQQVAAQSRPITAIRKMRGRPTRGERIQMGPVSHSPGM
jgi:transposase InsO family protein